MGIRLSDLFLGDERSSACHEVALPQNVVDIELTRGTGVPFLPVFNSIFLLEGEAVSWTLFFSPRWGTLKGPPLS